MEDKLKEVDFPLEYRYELLGEYAEAQEAQRRLLLFAGAAVITILLLLRASMRSWRLALLSLFTLPIALIGGVLAAFWSGRISLPRVPRRVLHRPRHREAAPA